MVPSMQGRSGIVTGASRGIGRAIALELAGHGARLVLTARSAADLEGVATEVRDLGGEAHCFAEDLTAPHAASALVEVARDRFGGIDFVVTNAGTAKAGDFLNLTDGDWEDGFALKFFAHVRLLRAAWPDLSSRRGSVVLIAGRAGRTPTQTTMITGAVNAALNNFTKALANRGIEDGVRVNAVNPGAIKTDRYKKRLAIQAENAGSTVEQTELDLIRTEEIIGIGEPRQVASVVAFLLGPDAAYMHGSLVDVDGGRTKTV